MYAPSHQPTLPVYLLWKVNNKTIDLLYTILYYIQYIYYNIKEIYIWIYNSEDEENIRQLYPTTKNLISSVCCGVILFCYNITQSRSFLYQKSILWYVG